MALTIVDKAFIVESKKGIISAHMDLSSGWAKFGTNCTTLHAYFIEKTQTSSKAVMISVVE